MRKVLATLFALAGLAAAASEVLILSAGEPLHLVGHLELVTLAILATVTAFYLFRSLAVWDAAMVCPSCHQSASLVPCAIGQPKPSVVALLLGGIIFTILLQHSRKSRFRCDRCSAECSRRTFGSWLAMAWALVLLLIIVAELALQ